MTFLADLRFAWRSLLRAKGLTLTVVVTLALGIGANAAIFSVVRGVLLRPLVNRDQDRLIYIHQSARGIHIDNARFSVPELRDLQSRVRTVAAFGDFSTIDFTLIGLGEPRVVRAGVVGGSYFEVMGLRAIRGRLLGPADDGPAAAGAAVLTHRFWTNGLKSDPSVVGKTITLSDRRATIVGILEPAVPYPTETEIIANVVTSPHHLDATMVEGRVHRMTDLFGRLAPGADLESARAELRAVHSAILAAHPQIGKLDITGGAPELHPDFDWLVTEAVALGKHVMVRHNLTVQLDGNPQTKESKEYLPGFFAKNRVEVISSLPYYQEFFTDAQRGSGVFKKSMEAMKRLNDVGYGAEGSGLALNLVYNPVGPYLPAPQAGLEADYKRELKAKFGLAFNNLYTITNMPINRFRLHLDKTGQYEAYMEKLLAAFNPAAAAGVMCRSLVSVGHDGRIYDCDFNQMLEMDAIDTAGRPLTIFDFAFERALGRPIRFDEHCLGCTAGAGSSCGGATAA